MCWVHGRKLSDWSRVYRETTHITSPNGDEPAPTIYPNLTESKSADENASFERSLMPPLAEAKDQELRVTLVSRSCIFDYFRLCSVIRPLSRVLTRQCEERQGEASASDKLSRSGRQCSFTDRVHLTPLFSVSKIASNLRWTVVAVIFRMNTLIG